MPGSQPAGLAGTQAAVQKSGLTRRGGGEGVGAVENGEWRSDNSHLQFDLLAWALTSARVKGAARHPRKRWKGLGGESHGTDSLSIKAHYPAARGWSRAV